MSELPLPMISVQGAPAECGASYGVAAAELIARNIEVYGRRFRDQAGLDDAAVRAVGLRFRTVTAEFHPRIAAMLDGVAAGAGVPAPVLYALNARTELLYDAALTRGPGGAGPPMPDGADGGCTVLGVLGTHTAGGHLLIGQNWDWHPDQRAAMVVLATRDERDHAVVSLAEAGMLAKAGLNSAGVGVCVTMLACDRDGPPPDGGAPGVPYHVLLRAALEADSLGWALRAVCRSPRNASVNLLIGQAGAAGGELIDVEVVPGDVGWLHPHDGLLTHANHLETPLPVHDRLKDWGGSSLFRAARARRLLAPVAARASVTEEDLAAVLRDHLGAPLAICRHVDPRDPLHERSETVYSVLLDLDARRFGLATGPPCAHDYAWLDIPT